MYATTHCHPGHSPRRRWSAAEALRHRDKVYAGSMMWLAFSLAVIVAIGCLWWFAWLRKDRRPPKPTRPYREWKD